MNAVMTDWGIGDVICSLYAVQGYAKKFPNEQINLYIRQHVEWAQLADIPQMRIKLYEDNMRIDKAVFLYHDKQDKDKVEKHTNSPKQLFASRLGVEPLLPNIKGDLSHARPVIEGRYIIFAPFAARINRTWEIHNWKILAGAFAKCGYKVIVLDSPANAARCKQIGAEYYFGQRATWVANACKNAALIIGNDSGLAHLGGWLGTKTLVLMAQLFPQQFYNYTANRFIVPQQKCTGCRFMPQYGYEDKCNYGCWVLQSISPDYVLQQSLDWLNAESLSAPATAGTVNA